MSQDGPVLHQDAFGAKLGMWLFLATEMVLFGGLFIAYAYLRNRYPVDFHRAGAGMETGLGVTNTVVLLTSSLTVALATDALKRGLRPRAMGFLAGSLGLGLVFLGIKGFEWAAKFQHGLYPKAAHLATLPQGEQIFYGLYFTMTGLHGLHVIVGLGLLSVMLALVRRGAIRPGRSTALENAGLYWHLVDIIWIFLLPLFYLAA
jgi:cytochrome c oxidase subunit III